MARGEVGGTRSLVEVEGTYVDGDARAFGATASPLDGQSLRALLLSPVQAIAVAFEKPTPIGLRLQITSEPDGLIAVRVTTRSGESWSFAFRPSPQTVACILVGIADGLQEHISETSETWGQARPPCQDHRHPARARIVGGEACWVCPEHGDILSPIDT